VFVPLAHPPGEAQVDIGQAEVVISGEPVTAAYFVMTLPHSDAHFGRAYPPTATPTISRAASPAVIVATRGQANRGGRVQVLTVEPRARERMAGCRRCGRLTAKRRSYAARLVGGPLPLHSKWHQVLPSARPRVFGLPPRQAICHAIREWDRFIDVTEGSARADSPAVRALDRPDLLIPTNDTNSPPG
jgi:hypothetical protein